MMPSRSSGMSSLLGPPTTVAEDEDSVVGDLPFQDENRAGWGYRNLRRANDSLVTELDDFASAAPVARAIYDFNQELDTLVNSFDSFFARKQERRPLETTSFNTPHQYAYVPTSTRTTPSRPKEAPPSTDHASPPKSSVHSTPARRFGSGSYTPSEPPPAPVETPGYGYPTPNRHRTRRPAPRGDISYASTRQEPSPVTRSNPVENSDSLEDLYRTIREQEIRIQDLEIENEVLRKKLTLQPPVIQRIHRSGPPSEDQSVPARFDPTVDVRRDRSELSGIREEPDGRRNPSTASHGQAPSPYRTQFSYLSTPSRQLDRPPRHIQTMEDPMDGLTAGTMFVAELATLMKIENSHYVPLSVIIDKHWDKLKQHFKH
jgi:hypothetical protein